MTNVNALNTDISAVVTGPSSSTDNALARFDGTTGKVVQNSSAILTDGGNLSLPSGANINVPGASYVAARSFNGVAVQFGGSNSSNLISIPNGQSAALTVTDSTAPNGYFIIDSSSQQFNFKVPVNVTKTIINGDTSHIGLDWVGITAENIERVPNNLQEALVAKDVAGNQYWHINSQTVYPKFSVDLPLQNNTVFIETLSAAFGTVYNTTGALTASCSGNTVTGIATSFPNGSALSNCTQGIIYWPSTQQLARITQVNSATSLTIDGSGITQATAPFIIFYNGITWNNNSNILSIASNTVLNSSGLIKLKPSIVTSTMSQSGILATITGVSSAFAGAYVVPASGNPFTILNYQGTTTVPTNVSQTIGGGTACTIYYFPFATITSLGMIDIDNSGYGSSVSLLTNSRFTTIGSGSDPGGITLHSNVNATQSFTSANVIAQPSNTSNFTASQSTTTVTGVGVSWDATYIGHIIRFGTGETAWITACPSSTTFTVTPSQTVAATSFDIPGKTSTNEATSMDARGNFGTVNAYISGSLNMPDHGVLITSGGNSLTLTTTGSTNVTLPTSGTLATTQGLPMTVVSGTSQSAAVNNSYVSNNAGLCTITLPSTAVVGDTIQVGGLGAGGWKVGLNASQLIHIGSLVTTTGTGGSLASTNQYDSISQIRCVIANTTWVCFGVQGNITVV